MLEYYNFLLMSMFHKVALLLLLKANTNLKVNKNYFNSPAQYVGYKFQMLLCPKSHQK